MISLVRLGFFIQPGKPGKARVLSLCLLEEVDKIASIVRTLGVLRSTYDLLAVCENFTGLNNQRSEITCSLAFVTA